jgi:UDP-glucose 4-epimerase
MSRILITGGNGFIASHLVTTLAAIPEHHVTVIDLYPRMYDLLPPGVTFVQGNLADVGLIRRTLEDQDIEVVYHLAWASIHETSLRNMAADIEANLIPTVHLFDECHTAGVKRVIYVSSGGTVYGVPQSLPIHEAHPTNPINAYGITKLAGEKYLQMLFHLNGLEYIIFRPSVPYGPRQSPHRRQGAIATFIYQALRRKPITIWGDGEVMRDYFYVDDMIEALLKALALPFEQSLIFNLAGMQIYTLNELVQMIQLALGVKIQVHYEPVRKFDVPQLRLDISAAAEKLAWKPTIPLLDGILRTASWLEKWVE